MNFWEGKNVFVTGATGFVGSWIAKNLVESKANVFVLTKDPLSKTMPKTLPLEAPNLKIISGNLKDYNLLVKMFIENSIDTVFHLAAQAIVGTANQSPLETFETNIMGTWNILEASRVTGVKRVIVASSDKAYGDHDKLPYTEDFPLLGSNPYDASKACADILARTYFKIYGLPVVVTRCSNIYGGGDMNFSRIVPDTVRSIIENKNPVIRTDGSPIRDYIYISDVVRAYLTLGENVEKVKGEAFNFGTEIPISVLDLVKKIIEISGKVHLVPDIQGKGNPKGEISKQYLSSEKSKKLLGWKPSVKLDEGIKETIKWYENYYKSIKS